MRYVKTLWINVFCHECNSSQDVKAIEIGSNCILLCDECRRKLKELLSK